MKHDTSTAANTEWAIAFHLARTCGGAIATYALRNAIYGRHDVCMGLPWGAA